jgi:sulfur transfer complex TusBCD TusB component (DsrH family)
MQKTSKELGLFQSKLSDFEATDGILYDIRNGIFAHFKNNAHIQTHFNSKTGLCLPNTDVHTRAVSSNFDAHRELLD